LLCQAAECSIIDQTEYIWPWSFASFNYSKYIFISYFSCTGEGGFNVFVPSENADDLAKALLEKSEGETCSML
jgi:glycine cleavage system aminomethyltransferase T